MVARKYHRTKTQMGGGNHHPPTAKSKFKEAKKSNKYTFTQKLKSAPHGAMARTVGAYQGLSTALVGTAKRGSEWLTRGALLSSAQRNAKRAQHAINVELGLRNKGLLGYVKSPKLDHLKTLTKMQTKLQNIDEKLKGNKYTKPEDITKAKKQMNFIKNYFQKQKGVNDNSSNYKLRSLFTNNGKVKTKEQLRKDLQSRLTLSENEKQTIEQATKILKTEFTPNSTKRMATAARLTQKQAALDAARSKIAERKLLLAKSGEEFKRLGSNVVKSYKQGKKDYYNARRAYGEYFGDATGKKIMAAPFALGAYLAYKAVARPLVDVGTELLNTKAGRALSRKVSKKTLSSDTIGLGQTIIAHQEKAVELGSKIETLKTNIDTNLQNLQSDSPLRENATDLSKQLETINKSRLDINSLRQKIKQTTEPKEKAKLFEEIKKKANAIKSGKVKLAELRQSILVEKATSPETVNKIISNFDNAYALLTQRNKYLDLSYDAERAIVSKAAKGKKFLEEAGQATREDITKKLNELGSISDYKTSITDEDFQSISDAFESVKEKMRESGSIGKAKEEWGNTYRYLNALLSNYGSENLVPKTNN